jgi:hypothetical protein
MTPKDSCPREPGFYRRPQQAHVTEIPFPVVCYVFLVVLVEKLLVEERELVI